MSVQEDFPALSPETAELYLPLWLDDVLPDDLSHRVAQMVAEDPHLANLANQMKKLDRELPRALSTVLDAPVPLGLARAAAQMSTPDSDPPQRDTLVRDELNKPSVVARAEQEQEQEQEQEAEEHSSSRGSNVHQLDDRRRNSFHNWGWQALAACVALALLGGPLTYQAGLSSGRQQAKPGWIEQVASYHRVYGAEERHLVEVASIERDHIRAWLGKRTGYDFEIPDLSVNGLRFAGARLLVASDGRPVGQLMYVQDDGRPIGFCFVKIDGSDRPLNHRMFDDIGIVTWSKNGHGFVVVGWEEAARLSEIAEELI